MEYIKPITSDHDLIALADIINVDLDNILSITEIDKPLPHGTYIILLQKPQSVGHWVAIHNDEYFDSYGVGPPKVLGDKLTYNKKQIQSTYGEYCGIYSMLWLCAKQRNKPELMEGYADLDIDVIDY